MSDAAVAREWIAAVNERDVERLIALADPELEVHTPRGVERGHDSARAFIARQSYGVAQVIEPTHIFAGPDVAVVFGRTDLRSFETGETMHSYPSAAVFQLRTGRVIRLALHGDLPSALADAGLDEHEHGVPRLMGASASQGASERPG